MDNPQKTAVSDALAGELAPNAANGIGQGRETPTPTKITPALHAYLTDWLAWVDRGAPCLEPYVRYYGLCSNAERYSADAFDEIRALFDADEYPFGGVEEYDQRGTKSTQHLNEARLAWCRSTLATAEITE